MKLYQRTDSGRYNEVDSADVITEAVARLQAMGFKVTARQLIFNMAREALDAKEEMGDNENREQ